MSRRVGFHAVAWATGQLRLRAAGCGNGRTLPDPMSLGFLPGNLPRHLLRRKNGGGSQRPTAVGFGCCDARP